LKAQDIKIEIPSPVGYILGRLNDAGFEAFAVGGCVRDAILGRTANDWDITTSALPSDVKKIFRRTIDTGIKHGTVTVLLHEGSFEVTTYRIDGIYEDSRHPKEVTFTSDLKEDLRRRDFTINAMAYHPVVGLVDPYDGIGDIELKVIRAVGNPNERFDEDALRIMRALRFAAQLGFSIETETYNAITTFAPRLELVSNERIRVELVKLLTSKHPEIFGLLYDTGITKIIFKDFDDCERREEVLSSITAASPEEIVRLAAMLSLSTDASADSKRAADWLREYKFDNDTIARVSKLILFRDFPEAKTEIGIRFMLNKIGPELYPFLIELMRAKGEAGADELELLTKLYEKILERGDCFDLKQLALKGADLIAAGVKPGREMGTILNNMLRAVIENPTLNTKDELMKLIKE